MTNLNPQNIYIPVSRDAAMAYSVDAVLINSDIDTGETVYIIPKSLFVFSKEELIDLLGEAFDTGHESFRNIPKETYINSLFNQNKF